MTPKQAYDHCVINGRNAELEKIILTDPRYAYYYALNIIKDRWIELENKISTNPKPKWAFYYALDIIKGRWPEVEKIISTDPEWSYRYARDIIKGRWVEAENIILTNPESAFYYAIEVINGKLPENMHNMMLLYADYWAKEYLKFINKS